MINIGDKFFKRYTLEVYTVRRLYHRSVQLVNKEGKRVNLKWLEFIETFYPYRKPTMLQRCLKFLFG